MGNPQGSHVMCIYSTRDSLVRHGLQYLKEGLDRNESCLLITHYLTKDKVKDIMAHLWGEPYMSGLKWTDDIQVVYGSKWYFRGRLYSFNIDSVMESWSNLSNNAISRGKHGGRVFADVGFFFRREMVQVLVNYESRVPPLRLKIICAYLASDLSILSDLSLLSKESYNTLQESHEHVYLIPDFPDKLT
jgi:hypothetical protein